MHEPEMENIAGFMARVLIEREAPESVMEDVIEFRQGYQTLYYDFEQGLPPR
jgi:glycine hydroxymethyltransferase